MKIIDLIFPFRGYLHIFQLLEYSILEFLRWVAPRWLDRNLQSVGQLKLTEKAKLLLLTALFIYLTFNEYLILTFRLDRPFLYLALLLANLLIPVWLILASLLVAPLETYLKNKIIKSAKEKLGQMPDLKIIAIAGSVGKSSTRSYVTKLLAAKYKAHTPTQNHNTLLGIANDINKNLGAETNYYVVEFGEYEPGDLVKLAGIVNPQELVLAKVGSQHLENFGSQEKINEEFLSLAKLKNIKKIFINDNNILFDQVKRVANFSTHTNTASESPSKNNEIIICEPEEIKNKYEKIELKLPKAGSTYENLALAIAVAKDKDLEENMIGKVIKSLEAFDQRLKVTEQNGVTIIDDSYNISFESALNALDYLKTFPGQKIVVTGGIVDQGKEGEKVNRNFAIKLGEVADTVIVAKNIYHDVLASAIKHGHGQVEVVTSPHPQKTPEILAAYVKSGDTVLIQNELPEEYWH